VSGVVGLSDEGDFFGDGSGVFGGAFGGVDARRGEGDLERLTEGGVELAAGEGEDGFEARGGFGAVGEEGVDEGSFDLQGRGEEAVSQEGVGVAAAVSPLVGEGPGEVDASFAAAHRGVGGGGAGCAEAEGPVGAGEALVAGEGWDVWICPGSRGVEGEGVSEGEGGLVGGGAGPDDFQRVSIFFPETQVEAVGSLEVLPGGLAVRIDHDVDGGAGEGGRSGGLIGFESEASGDPGNLEVDGAGGGVAEDSPQSRASGIGAGVRGGGQRGAHSGAVTDQSFELHRDLGVVSDRQGEAAEFEAVEPGAQDGAFGEEGEKGGVDSLAGGLENVLVDAGSEGGFGDSSEEVLEEVEDGSGG